VSDVATKVARGIAEVERLAGECGGDGEEWAVKRGVMEGLRKQIATMNMQALRDKWDARDGKKGGPQ